MEGHAEDTEDAEREDEGDLFLGSRRQGLEVVGEGQHLDRMARTEEVVDRS